MKRKLASFLVIVIVFALGKLYYQNNTLVNNNNLSDSPINLEEAVITKYVDGDTIYVKLKNGVEKKVRFTGINSPENTARIDPYGKEASDYTEQNLKGKTIYLEKDISETDQYERLLRYIWIEPPTEISEHEIRTKMFNAILVLEGYAHATTYPPDVKYSKYLNGFEKEACESNKGLWSFK